MIGGLKQTTSRLAIAAAAGLFTGGIALTPVQAADLGGDCCADLEERVAELEATTVRKGNRKVSVKLSGQVKRSIMWWDDGYDDDVYLTDNGHSHSRFRISGSATISPGRTAGFIYEHDLLVSNDPNCLRNFSAKVANCVAPNQQRFADLWVKDDKLGKVSLGQGNTASNGIAEIDLSGTYVASMDSGMNYNVSNFVYRAGPTGAVVGPTVGQSWSNQDGGSRQDRIRYDTPSLGGFTLSTSYWADDGVDFAARFAKEWNSVRCAMGIATMHETDEDSDDRWTTSGSVSCIHTPSGLNLTFAAGDEDEGALGAEANYWFLKLGISRRWNSHGKTSIAVAYGEGEDNFVTGDDTTTWSVGIVQAIDSAAMELFLVYHNFEYDNTTTNSFEEIEAITAGASIKF